MKNLPIHIQDKLTKIAALATSGVDGEKDSAMQLLEKLCAKYYVSIEDVLSKPEEEELSWYEFRYHLDIQRDLLFQLIYKYKDVSNISYRSKNGTKLLEFKLTKFQYIIISEAYIYFSKLMKDEFKKIKVDFLAAFCYKHELYGPTPCSEKRLGEETDEVKRARELEERRIRAMASGLADSNFIPGRLLEN